MIKSVFLTVSKMCRLKGEEQQEGHHQTEKSHGFWEGETQDGVREKLLLQGWVPRVTDDQGTENAADTGTWEKANEIRFSII